MQIINLNIKYHLGKANHVTYALSRRKRDATTSKDVQELTTNLNYLKDVRCDC